MAFAPSSAGQPPIATTAIRKMLTSSSRTTIARVALTEALSRLGWTRTTSRGVSSSLAIRWRMIRTARLAVRHYSAGVVELADTPALGAGGASRGGSNPSARIRRHRERYRLHFAGKRGRARPLRRPSNGYRFWQAASVVHGGRRLWIAGHHPTIGDSPVMRVGVVLGAGGVVGASWLIGALEALESETGWRTADAEVIVGTSAGSVVGTLAATGIPPALMAAYASGNSLEGFEPPEGLEIDVAELEPREAGDGYRLALALPPIGPGSWRMALSTLRNPLRHSPSAVLCGWLPRGFVSTAPIARIVDKFVPGEWPEHPNLWIVGCDYATGRRTAFGRADAPPARLRDAVAASCAIPAFYHPAKIDGRRYVDGGICSVSNADLLCGRGLDMAIVLNPMTSLAQATGGSPADRAAALMRAASGRRLGRELRKLREEGTEVLCLQPTKDDIA